MKVVINTKFGGFGLSYEGVMEYAKQKKIKLYGFVEKRKSDGHLDLHKHEPYTGGNAFLVHYSTKPLKNDTCENDTYFSERDIDRADPALIATIKKLKSKANGCCANLKIIKIPDGIDFVIEEYDGLEHVAEKHKTWN